MGPILFNIYITLLFEIIDSFPQISLYSYADDIHIYIPASNPNDLCLRLRESFSKISNWFEYNSLKLNYAKTNAMFIDYRKKSIPV